MNPQRARLAVSTRGRALDPLGWPTGSDPDLPLIQQAVANSSARMHWISGGEPTLRSDLPALITTLSENGPTGLDTDGLALVTEPIIQGLISAGLERVRIGLHSSHSDAHDWLVGLPGAARRVRRALRACLQAGLEVHSQIVLSRPTTEHLPETIALLRHMGIRILHIRRPYLSPALQDRAIAMSPRLGLLEPWLESALHEAEEMDLFIHDIPPCVAPGVPIRHFQREPWVLPEGLELHSETSSKGCPTCPHDSRCSGAPSDYVHHFGRLELNSSGPLARDAIRVPTTPLESATPPPVRAGRTPATRLRQVHRQLALGRLYGDPINGQDPSTLAEQICVRLEGSSREIRKAMVQAAQEGCAELVVEAVGTVPHPELAGLLRDSGRLSFERVILRASALHIESLGEQKHIALRRVTRIDDVPSEPQAAEPK